MSLNIHITVTAMCECLWVFFVAVIFNEGAYLTWLIFHKALKDGIFAFCYLRILKEPVFPSVYAYYGQEAYE